MNGDMVAAGHHIARCDTHYHVLSRCRCPGPHLTKWIPCPGPPTCVGGEASDSNSQLTNRKNAFRHLRETDKWKMWFREMCLATQGLPTLEEKIEEAMRPEHIRTQIQVDGKWVDSEY